MKVIEPFAQFGCKAILSFFPKMTNPKDRHLQKSGHQSDLKAVAKKRGAGKANWGSEIDLDIKNVRGEVHAAEMAQNKSEE